MASSDACRTETMPQPVSRSVPNKTKKRFLIDQRMTCSISMSDE